MEKLIITVAPTNTKWFKSDNPHMPQTPDEIARDAIEAFQEGAVVAHIHARDEDGQMTFETKYFRKIVERIRAETDMIIQLSTAGAAVPYKKKLEPIFELKSDMASLNIQGADEEIEYNAKFMRDHGIVPIIEAFDMGMIEKANRLIEKGLVSQPAHYELVFDLESKPDKSLIEDFDELLSRVKAIWPGSVWSRNRGAKHQFELDALTIMLGGHLRVGMEDNIYISQDQLASGSAEFVKRVKKLCKIYGREIASTNDAKKIFQPNS
jgi:3-keto-5-aminohexanoate cleavage enzyme